MSRRSADGRAARPTAYTVFAALETGEVIAAADLLLETDARGRHRRSGLEYRDEWVNADAAFPLDPVHAPLKRRRHEWHTTGHTPSVIDEVLPGAWERALLKRAWDRAGTPADPDDLNSVLSERQLTLRVGASAILSADSSATSDLQLASALDRADLEKVSQHAEEISDHTDLELDVLQRLRAGTTVGGARPKILIHHGGREFIAKFNRRDDPFDHARVEHACLELARCVGIEAPASELVTVGEGVCLLVERFDVTEAGGRRQLLSANALLKDPVTCADATQARYEDLVELIRRFSDDPASDLQQLYMRMLFNEAINNRDDHLRNFSFLRRDGRLRLAPAYDLVPTDALGAYPVLGFERRATLPRPMTEAGLAAARTFGVRPREAEQANQRLEAAFVELASHLDAAGVSERDRRILERVCWTPAEGAARG